MIGEVNNIAEVKSLEEQFLFCSQDLDIVDLDLAPQASLSFTILEVWSVDVIQRGLILCWVDCLSVSIWQEIFVAEAAWPIKAIRINVTTKILLLTINTRTS